MLTPHPEATGHGQDRSTPLDTLIHAISTADTDTLLALRHYLLSAMFPAMPKCVREVVVPLYELVTLETQAIEQGLPRLGATARLQALIGAAVVSVDANYPRSIARSAPSLRASLNAGNESPDDETHLSVVADNWETVGVAPPGLVADCA